MKCTIIPALLALLAANTQAGVVLSQPDNGTGALLQSSRYAPNGPDYDQFVWDSFVVPTAQAVTWVQIEAEMANGLPHWGWAAGTGNGSYFRRIAGQADFYFQFISGDAAFSIVTSDGPTCTLAASASPAGSGSIVNTGLYQERPDLSAGPWANTTNAVSVVGLLHRVTLTPSTNAGFFRLLHPCPPTIDPKQKPNTS